MKPKPFSALNHFTVPSGMCCSPAAKTVSAPHITAAGPPQATAHDMFRGRATHSGNLRPGLTLPDAEGKKGDVLATLCHSSTPRSWNRRPCGVTDHAPTGAGLPDRMSDRA